MHFQWWGEGNLGSLKMLKRQLLLLRNWVWPGGQRVFTVAVKLAFRISMTKKEKRANP